MYRLCDYKVGIKLYHYKKTPYLRSLEISKFLLEFLNLTHLFGRSRRPTCPLRLETRIKFSRQRKEGFKQNSKQRGIVFIHCLLMTSRGTVASWVDPSRLLDCSSRTRSREVFSDSYICSKSVVPETKKFSPGWSCPPFWTPLMSAEGSGLRGLWNPGNRW